MSIDDFIARLSILDEQASAPLDARRRRYEALHQHHRPADPPGMRVEDTQIAGVGIRRFMPPSVKPGPVVYLHGGGWNLGSVQSHHGITANLASRLSREVISVEYRLLPEASYAEALADCVTVVEATGPVALGGDSAGGRLAIDVAATTDWPGVLGLIYPVVGTPTLATLGEDAPLLTRADVLSLWQMANQGTTIDRGPMPAVDPHRPPAEIIEALAVERDPLTRPLENAIEQWRAAGARVGYRCAPDMVHSALHGHAELEPMKNAWQQFCQALDRRLG
ncbi:alpha/beta hydrolase fold domain-containing protein [Salinicola rhizosphaerae]|uniref:Lipolytic protein n=1 Tax=Salinicola rhizosphaerae TaxID=1443141 RepID=A0ABQ3E8X5_9GAMM|nr:alpha/beta hydrolase fold domain-containing protein [Salinicola rhizosphaerae]GHB24806.1 lipolytic protein [Salinicola rhizosphaerae]